MQFPVLAATAPAAAPTHAGMIHIDTVAKRLWFAVGTSAVTDWIQVSSSSLFLTGSDGRQYFFNDSTKYAGGDDLYYEVIVQNAGGVASITLSDAGVAALP